MDDQPQERDQATSDAVVSQTDRDDERLSRREERRAARRARRGDPWIGGVILIGAGIILILQNAGVLLLDNWWALFILIPALGAFAAAWRSYQDAGGRLTAPARGSLIGGLILTVVAAIFLFGLDWGSLGPILLIIAGIGILLNVLLPG